MAQPSSPPPPTKETPDVDSDSESSIEDQPGQDEAPIAASDAVVLTWAMQRTPYGKQQLDDFVSIAGEPGDDDVNNIIALEELTVERCINVPSLFRRGPFYTGKKCHKRHPLDTAPYTTESMASGHYGSSVAFFYAPWRFVSLLAQVLVTTSEGQSNLICFPLAGQEMGDQES